MIDAAFCSPLQPVEKFIERADEVGALLRRKRLADRDAVAPWRQRLVDFELQSFGNPDEGVLVGRVQPAAAEVEGHAGRSRDGVAAAADAVARLQHDE